MATLNTYIPFRGRVDQCKGSFPAMTQPAGLVSGTGSPEGVVFGNPGQRYRDTVNDDLYIKFQGTQEFGWRLVGTYTEGGTSSTTGSGNIVSSAVDPTGVVAVAGAAICLGTDAVLGKIWVKVSDTNTADDWFLVIG